MPEIVEIRDPIHGFIKLNDWERAIIDQPAFQRLRRIRQLGLTDIVYPGAMHTRFEHSLGVMHLASQMYESIVEHCRGFLRDELGYLDDDVRVNRYRRIVRLAALLHDVGHPPLSHAGDSLMPKKEDGNERYTHENYSAQVIKLILRDVIEEHDTNRDYELTADDVAELIDTDDVPRTQDALLWRALISGFFDADRGDYLLRDSYHAGVAYGNYDLPRLLATLRVVLDENDSPILAFEKGGRHVVEEFIIARYMMFNQVYFHHTRRVYDHHLENAFKEALMESQKDDSSEAATLPPPTTRKSIENYLTWDDWRLLGAIQQSNSESACIIKERRHYRKLYETEEMASHAAYTKFDKISERLEGNVRFFCDSSQGTWYDPDSKEIYIVTSDSDSDPQSVVSLSSRSRVIRNLKSSGRHRIYVAPKDMEKAKCLISDLEIEKGEK